MTKKQIKKELKDLSKNLTAYKIQLLARHAEAPLVSPPVFRLSISVAVLDHIVKNI